MNMIQKALAYGPIGVAGLVGGFIYAQHELHYWLTPAHMANVGLAAGAVGAVGVSVIAKKTADKVTAKKAAKKAAKAKAVKRARKDQEAVSSWSPPAPQALPRMVPTQHFLSEDVVEQRLEQLSKSLKTLKKV